MHRASTRMVLIVAVAMLFLVPMAAIAAGNFEDVDEDSPFKADIEWLAEAGVTKGCNPPANTEFCPSSNVTREQMAAFMHRLANNQVVDAATVQGMDPDDLKGATGPAGPAGPAGVDGWEVVSGWTDPTLSISVPAGQTKGLVAYCPEGKIVTGGGYSVDPWLVVNENYVFWPGSPANAWWIRVVNDTASAGNARVHAICVDAAS